MIQSDRCRVKNEPALPAIIDNGRSQMAEISVLSENFIDLLRSVLVIQAKKPGMPQ